MLHAPSSIGRLVRPQPARSCKDVEALHEEAGPDSAEQIQLHRASRATGVYVRTGAQTKTSAQHTFAWYTRPRPTRIGEGSTGNLHSLGRGPERILLVARHSCSSGPVHRARRLPDRYGWLQCGYHVRKRLLFGGKLHRSCRQTSCGPSYMAWSPEARKPMSMQGTSLTVCASASQKECQASTSLSTCSCVRSCATGEATTRASLRFCSAASAWGSSCTQRIAMKLQAAGAGQCIVGSSTMSFLTDPCLADVLAPNGRLQCREIAQILAEHAETSL